MPIVTNDQFQQTYMEIVSQVGQKDKNDNADSFEILDTCIVNVSFFIMSIRSTIIRRQRQGQHPQTFPGTS